MRLIDAERFSETLRYYIKEAGWSEETNTALKWCIEDFIPAEPTVGPEPVKQGKWERNKNHNSYWAWICSACNSHMSRRTKYCPECGAKMEL